MTQNLFEVGKEYESCALSTARVVWRCDNGNFVVYYPLNEDTRIVRPDGICTEDADFTIYPAKK